MLKKFKFDTSDGKQSRDFLYVTDLVDVIIKILKNKKTRGKILMLIGFTKKIKKNYSIHTKKLNRANLTLVN